MNIKQTLRLTRSHVDTDCYISGTDKITIILDKLEWRIPFIQLNEHLSLEYYNVLNSDKPVSIWFRKCDIIELPTLTQSTNEIWVVKSLVEKVNFILVAFHTDRRWKHDKDASLFDHCNVSNMKVYLNSNYYPLENLNLNISNNNYLRAYQMYLDIFNSYQLKERSAHHN